MYTEGNIIYFDPFYFKDGVSSKRKYFLVLKNIGDTAILASLPSSVVHLPNFVEIKHGCVNISESCIGCYIFKEKQPITKCGWAFDLNTFLYSNWVDEYDLSVLMGIYQIEGLEYEIIGQLTDVELNNVLDCFRNSSIIKRRYKKLLQ